MVVVRKLQGGAYILAELDGSVWQNKVVAFRVLPYLSRRKFDFKREVKDFVGRITSSEGKVVLEFCS